MTRTAVRQASYPYNASKIPENDGCLHPAGTSKSYIVHPTSYIGAARRLRPRATRANFPNRTSYIPHRTWAAPVCHRSFLTTPAHGITTSRSPRLRLLAQRARIRQIVHRTSHIVHRRRQAPPPLSNHARSPLHLSPRLKLRLPAPQARELSKSYLVHRTSYMGRPRLPPLLSNYARAWYHDIPLAPAPPPRAAGARAFQIVHRTSYIGQTHFLMRLPLTYLPWKMIMRQTSQHGLRLTIARWFLVPSHG